MAARLRKASMVWALAGALCASLAAQPGRAQAQAATRGPSASPSAAVSGTPAPSAAHDAQAGLERAQRMADNPLRHILRASRLPARAALANAAAAPAVAQEVVLILAPPWAEAEAPGPAAVALDLASLAQALDLSGPPAWPELAALPPVPQHDPLPPAPEVPQLHSMVQPELDARLRAQLGPVDAVDAVLSLRTDGSVAAVAFDGMVDLRLRRVLSRALQQWRFAPLQMAQAHRVRLDFPAQP